MEKMENLPAGLYVHIPFCRMKCLYCDFYSVTSTSGTAEWLHSLDQEAALYTDRFSCFDTLYLGGGTPTLLTEKELGRLVESLFGRFRFAGDAEVSLEANPDDITAEKLHACKELGFNRISLGVQSMDDRDLRFLGRRHTAGQAARAMDLIRNSGFSQFGIDLICGLPGQTEAGWKKTLEKALTFSPDHVSCYQLTPSKGTRLWEMQEGGLVSPLGEERERSLFLATSEILEGHGFAHYEVSNYARQGEPLHVCRHNLKYWERAPYLGLGPSAHSFQGNLRWWNHRSVAQYCRDLDQGRRPIQGSERLSDEQASLERLSLGLRTKTGIPIRELQGYRNSEGVLPGLLQAGYLEMIDKRAVPTREGFLVADRLPLLFL
jgi:oxygen-independent coproporphyrinogen-3 oxidase